MRTKYFKLKEGLVKVVDELNNKFSSMGKFQLKEKGDTFYIHYKKGLFSRELGDTKIEVLPDRIGYRPSNCEYGRIVDECL